MSVFERSTQPLVDHPAFQRHDCPTCLGRDLIPFHHLPNIPVHVGVTYDSQEDARHAPVGDMLLCFCQSCGLVFNAAFDASKLDYAPGYDASITSSDQFMRFLDAIIDHLIERYELPGKTVLEIGCGVGHFLRRLCERAACHGVGIDPALPSEGREPIGDHTITWVQNMYGPEHADLPCDLLCGLDMFELLPDPYAFLQSIRRVLPASGGTPVYFESPSREHVFDGGAGWSLYYEQCIYYDMASYRGLFERSGFDVTHVAHYELNDQCMYIEAVTRPIDSPANSATNDVPAELPQSLAEFGQAQHQRMMDWSRRLTEWFAQGRDVVLWGSGGKGINFLNTVAGAERIRRVVDVNPARQGRYLPRAGQQVVAPAALVEAPPSVVLVSNPLWHDEIAGTIAELEIDCELLDVSP